MSAGRHVPQAAVRIARTRGIDLTGHSSTVVSVQLLKAADLVFVMDEAQERALYARFGRVRATVVILGDLDPSPITQRAIRDPWRGSDETFEETFGRIERCVAALVAILERM